MNNVKPCPFCGGITISAYRVEWKEGGENYKPNWAIHCLECGCGFNDIFETKDDAINRWNERVMQHEKEKDKRIY